MLSNLPHHWSNHPWWRKRLLTFHRHHKLPCNSWLLLTCNGQIHPAFNLQAINPHCQSCLEYFRSYTCPHWHRIFFLSGICPLILLRSWPNGTIGEIVFPTARLRTATTVSIPVRHVVERVQRPNKKYTWLHERRLRISRSVRYGSLPTSSMDTPHGPDDSVKPYSFRNGKVHIGCSLCRQVNIGVQVHRLHRFQSCLGLNITIRPISCTHGTIHQPLVPFPSWVTMFEAMHIHSTGMSILPFTKSSMDGTVTQTHRLASTNEHNIVLTLHTRSIHRHD